MFPSIVDRTRCPRCDGPLALHVFAPAEDGHIKDGIACCNACRSGYPIDGELLLLAVPALMPEASAHRFAETYRAELAALDVTVQCAQAGSQEDEYHAQREQRDHFEWYAENETQDYIAYAQSPFWKAEDTLVFDRWRRELPGKGWLLDVGSANGRATFPMAMPGAMVVGLDVSEALLRQAIRQSYANGTHARVSFLLADGDQIPFQDDSFDCVMTYGVLHHLPNPEKSCKEFQRILAPGGVYLGSENNDSLLRPVFDLLMKLRPLWWEKAGAEPLISAAKLAAWHEGENVAIHTRYSVYLPPHLFNLAGENIALAAMRISDSLFNALPLVRRLAGIVIYEVRALRKPVSPDIPK